MNDLSKSKLSERVTITCYNQTETMTRREALELYYDAMRNTEGSERERYESIFFQLMDGENVCTDDILY